MSRKSALMLVGLICLAAWSASAATLYVDADISGGAQSGADWDNAFASLTQALAAASSGDSIWMAQGVYYPTHDATNRAVAFSVSQADLSIYGGFTNGMQTLGERDWDAYPTVLSGEIQQDGISTNNSSRVCYVNADGVHLDGLTITAGYGNYTADGVGVYAYRADLSVMNCLVVSNQAGNYGAGCYYRSGNMYLSNCVFRGNSGDNIGGAVLLMDLDTFGITGLVADCQFINNYSGTAGGLGLFNGPTATVARCLFSGNSVLNSAGAMQCQNVKAQISDCIFNGNWCSLSGGGAVYLTGGSPEFLRCVFCGNRSTNNSSGGALIVRSHATINSITRLEKCVFAGNSAQVSGGAVALASSNYIDNCTFYKNQSTSSGYGGALWSQTYLDMLDIQNSMFWSNNNTGAHGHEMYLTAGGTNVDIGYTLVSTNAADFQTNDVNVTLGPGHLAGDPLFPEAGSRTWSDAMTENHAAGQCTLTDSTQSWAVNEHAGRLVLLANTYHAAYYVVSNTPTALTVWGNAATLAGAPGDHYEILDVHPQSKAGRWTPLGRTADALTSPCIDAGDPAAAYASEPRPNGRRLNLGAYGNTAEASQSVIPAGTLIHLY